MGDTLGVFFTSSCCTAIRTRLLHQEHILTSLGIINNAEEAACYANSREHAQPRLTTNGYMVCMLVIKIPASSHWGPDPSAQGLCLGRKLRCIRKALLSRYQRCRS
ncbi:unnamed protein product [Periconia digitata]|uniref:Uncharacterized protein n=1 Tax=Periconia digitata TaxID=1303443 RepID=A0A9W4XP16_9PLEO|nr:unnamed protein product [Periconia digitata]